MNFNKARFFLPACSAQDLESVGLLGPSSREVAAAPGLPSPAFSPKGRRPKSSGCLRLQGLAVPRSCSGNRGHRAGSRKSQRHSFPHVTALKVSSQRERRHQSKNPTSSETSAQNGYPMRSIRKKKRPSHLVDSGCPSPTFHLGRDCGLCPQRPLPCP